jgi:hypothetical protein
MLRDGLRAAWLFTRRLARDPMWELLFPLLWPRLVVMFAGQVPSSLGQAVAGSLDYEPAQGAATWSRRGMVRRTSAREVAGLAVFMVVGLVTVVLPLIVAVEGAALGATLVELPWWVGPVVIMSPLLVGLPAELGQVASQDRTNRLGRCSFTTSQPSSLEKANLLRCFSRCSRAPTKPKPSPQFDKASLQEPGEGRVRGLARDASRICIAGREGARPHLDHPLRTTVM